MQTAKTKASVENIPLQSWTIT